jgi:hypothetical protein
MKPLLALKEISQWPLAYRVLLVITLAYSVLCAYKGGDFDVFLGAGQKLSEQQNIYRPPFIKDLQYFYSPFFALLLVPFSYLPFFVTELAWLLLSTYLLYRIWKLTTRYLPVQLLTKRESNW